MNLVMNSAVFHRKLIFGLLISILVVLFGLVWWVFAKPAQAANFSISPASGTYTVGSTFDVSVLVDTNNQEINAVQMQLAFPADKLQLVSPSAGSSIIEIYTTPPRFDNSRGTVSIVGGIPNGVNVKSGLISKLTFRVKGVGPATLRFTGESQILLNDGRGTNVMDNALGATYKLELPPQQGPIVLSDTHPDQEIWYSNNNVNLKWDVGLEPASNYSYTISDNPTDTPDDTPETSGTSVNYKQVSDGINYFHIKAFRDGRWGGISHYSLKIDTTAPADFPISVIPSARTKITNPIFDFKTTDSLSGVDRYEIKIVPLKIDGRPGAVPTEQLFVQTDSPYRSPDLLYGSYDAIVRVYDKAGNIREVVQRVEISNSLFWFLSQDGLVLPFNQFIKWPLAFAVLLLLLILLLVIAYILRKWYKLAHEKVVQNQLPSTLANQIMELHQYKAKYGKLLVLVLVLFGFASLHFGSAHVVLAQTTQFIDDSSEAASSQPTSTPTSIEPPGSELTPPVISSYSSNIKDDELFYVSGRTVEPNSEVVVHLQSLVNGSAFDFTVSADRRGDWSYRHDGFLSGGKYIVWAHAKDGNKLSSPSPQVEMDVKPIAINWGNSRITYQTVYLSLIGALVVGVLGLLIYIILHGLLLRRRRLAFADSVRAAEDGLRTGFLSLKRDLEAELTLMKRVTDGGELAGEQKVRAEQLHQDISNIERIIGLEIAQAENYAHLPHNSV